jgi:hypothetical protein
MEKPLESDKHPSLWPLALLGTLLFALVPSKRKDYGKTVSPHDNPSPRTNLTPGEQPVISEIPPAPSECRYPDGRRDDTPSWKKRTEIAMAVGTVGLLIINIF